jgi:cyclic pyranopterin phosphate synthase
MPKIVDRRGRPLRDLRVSVTDRCNFRCPYCMPREVFGSAHRFLPRAEILSFEEIVRTVRVFETLGVEKVRLTGGEPLLRAELPKLVRMLTEIQGLDLALTTNGSLLARLAPALADAGLRRITVSLDSLDADVFRKMSDTDVPITDVLSGIDAAVCAGLSPVKINCVVRRAVNDASVMDLARRFQGTGVTVRFIEFMDVGATNGWDGRDVVPAREIVERIDQELPLEPLDARYPGEVARRYRYRDGSGEIGVIASVTHPFCGSCSRARLSADGHLYTCLFATLGVDLRPALRAAPDDDAPLRQILEESWNARDDRYSEIRFSARPLRKIEMSYIGG